MYNVKEICIHYRRSIASADQFSSLAQSVEHLTVNQGVVGSSPTGGVCYYSNYEITLRVFYGLRSKTFGSRSEILAPWSSG